MNTPSPLSPPEIIIFFPGCAGDRGEGKSQFITAALLLPPPPHQKRWIVTNKLSAVSRRQKGIEEEALINLFSRICCINNGKERLFYAKWMCACSAFFPFLFRIQKVTFPPWHPLRHDATKATATVFKSSFFISTRCVYVRERTVSSFF